VLGESRDDLAVVGFLAGITKWRGKLSVDKVYLEVVKCLDGFFRLVGVFELL
jgi:hypothetical protein